jgi:glycosyltransferase involved in cell wall biosynthesis
MFAAGFDDRISHHKLVGIAKPIQYLKYPTAMLWIPQAWAMIRSIKPDIVDAHYITGYGYIGIASGFYPLVLTAWGSDILITPKRNPILKILTQAALRRADRIVCDSRILKCEIIQMGIRPEKISIIQFGVDTQRFSPAQRNDELRTRLAISNAPIVTCIRSLKPVYNVSTVIRTIPLVLAKAPQAQFIIAGDGSQSTYLVELANSLNISANVHFMGQIAHHEIPKLLASSDVYVSTSLSDSTSLSLQEAMACGLPTVVSDLPANREWVKDGESGYIRSARDVQDIAECIITLLNNPSQRQEFGKLGRARIVSEADYIVNLQKAERMYQELIR